MGKAKFSNVVFSYFFIPTGIYSMIKDSTNYAICGLRSNILVRRLALLLLPIPITAAVFSIINSMLFLVIKSTITLGREVIG